MPEAKPNRTQFEHANPILKVVSLARSVQYYVDVLGFSNAEWGTDDLTCVSRDGASIYLSEHDHVPLELGCGSALETSKPSIASTSRVVP